MRNVLDVLKFILVIIGIIGVCVVVRDAVAAEPQLASPQSLPSMQQVAAVVQEHDDMLTALVKVQDCMGTFMVAAMQESTMHKEKWNPSSEFEWEKKLQACVNDATKEYRAKYAPKEPQK